MLSANSVKILLALWLTVISLVDIALAEKPRYVVATIDGREMRVRDTRRPALYTADYGDCLGESAINVTRFDAAYYKDNMTIIFHLAGETALPNEAIMMYIGVYAYGESRFDLTFNPCDANIESACPVKAGTAIEAAGIIPINKNDVAGIPDIALSIPDFEGEAILRLFSNSTQAEIGCFAAQITNGNTFQQKATVGSSLGIFTLIALLSSFATAIYGDDVVVIRKHYAHSLSIQVVFAVWHHIFYSGALSMNWPSVLVAFWSNYAWAGGMIYSESMQNTINDFIGANKGNTSQVGAAGTGDDNPGLGGGYDIQQIYTRGVLPRSLGVQNTIAKRHLIDTTSGFKYYGQPVKPGLPLPGNYSGFPGTLAPERIPASNAFMTGLLWLLILVACVVVSVVVLKVTLEGLSRGRLVKKDRLALFKAHYLGYIAAAVLRTLLIGFFMMTFLTLFQFSYLASRGPVAVACVVFIGMLFGLGILGFAACYYRFTFGEYVSEPDRLNLEKRKMLRFLPWFAVSRASKKPRAEDNIYTASLPWWTFRAQAGAKSIHSDEGYIRHFGWLASRYRRTRWWFFVVWIVYEFVRACLLAGASRQPMVQIFGLLAVELIAFVGMIFLRPFEGQRLNVIVVYLLGFSKVATVALSAAFDTRFNLPRILGTVVGIIIIVIQSLLTTVVMVAIITGALTSYMSVMRNREDIRPKHWAPIREKYFKHMDFRAQDTPRPPLSPVESELKVLKSPSFNVKHVKRMAKVEDEDAEFIEEIYNNPSVSQFSLSGHARPGLMELTFRHGNAASIHSQMSHSSRPKAARLHRSSWSLQSYNDIQRPGRLRTTSNTMLIPKGLSRSSYRDLPHLNTQLGSLENLDKQSSPLSTSAREHNTPASSPILHIVDDSDPASPGGRAMSRLTSKSRSSSRPNLETKISEEDILPLSEKIEESDNAEEAR